MAGTLQIYMGVLLTIDGEINQVGSLVSPVAEVTLAGDYSVASKFTCSSGGGELTVWVRGNTDDFDAWWIRPIGSVVGTIWIAYQFKDTDSNGDPTGDPYWMHMQVPTQAGAMVLWTDSIRVPASMPANIADFYEDASDRPKLWDTSMDEGLITKIMVRNPGDEDILIERLIAN